MGIGELVHRYARILSFDALFVYPSTYFPVFTLGLLIRKRPIRPSLCRSVCLSACPLFERVYKHLYGKWTDTHSHDINRPTAICLPATIRMD